ncbi:hypothetical protein M0811_03071 [Anaeramoeba ignava]|uniref:Uncharacterized protein n=1 Tax=Anaeramoeba ignava TaxID=1746090 RepID=A0A9Q0L5L4_ANAIG|nr:hypothetical protein M0811_03071 [Anaeramoeba ignava]
MNLQGFYEPFLRDYYDKLMDSIYQQLLLPDNLSLNYKVIFSTLKILLREFHSTHLKKIIPLIFNLQENIVTRFRQKRLSAKQLYFIQVVIFAYILFISKIYKIEELSKYIISLINGIENWNKIDLGLNIKITSHGIKIDSSQQEKQEENQKDNENNNLDEDISEEIINLISVKMEKEKVAELISNQVQFSNKQQAKQILLSEHRFDLTSTQPNLKSFFTDQNEYQDKQFMEEKSNDDESLLEIFTDRKGVKSRDASYISQMRSDDESININESEIEMDQNIETFTSSKLKEVFNLTNPVQNSRMDIFESVEAMQTRKYEELYHDFWDKNQDSKSKISKVFDNTDPHKLQINNQEKMKSFEFDTNFMI